LTIVAWITFKSYLERFLTGNAKTEDCLLKRFPQGNARTGDCLLKRFPKGNAQTGDCLRSKQLSKQLSKQCPTHSFISPVAGQPQASNFLK
jgi:hypothetical protein